MRVRWWLVCLFGGVLLGAVSAILLTGAVQFPAFCLGVTFVVFALYRRAGGTDYSRERPVPPGEGGLPGGDVRYDNKVFERAGATREPSSSPPSPLGS